jgi:hypothetical protein
MKRAYYSNHLAAFAVESPDSILGQLARNSEFAVEQPQRDAWLTQIDKLRRELAGLSGTIHLEFAIPRMGRRVDAVFLCGPAVFVIECKVGSDQYSSHAIEQVTDYGLDLKHFHEGSHAAYIVPILIATHAPPVPIHLELTPHRDRFFKAIHSNGRSLGQVVREVLHFIGDDTQLDSEGWEQSGYRPTPTIIEAATALYNGHSVAEISRSDAGGAELARTTDMIGRVIADARENSFKAICFVTGVPGAGKTLIGLNKRERQVYLKNAYRVLMTRARQGMVICVPKGDSRDPTRDPAFYDSTFEYLRGLNFELLK